MVVTGNNVLIKVDKVSEDGIIMPSSEGKVTAVGSKVEDKIVGLTATFENEYPIHKFTTDEADYFVVAITSVYICR